MTLHESGTGTLCNEENGLNKWMNQSVDSSNLLLPRSYRKKGKKWLLSRVRGDMHSYFHPFAIHTAHNNKTAIDCSVLYKMMQFYAAGGSWRGN